MRFQKGDKVRIHRPKVWTDHPYWASEMDVYDGKVVTLNTKPKGSPYWKIGIWSFNEDWMELVKGAEMQKRDLENGDVVEFKNGERAVVWGSYFMTSPHGDLTMSSWTDDLINTGALGHSLDVMKVKKEPAYPFDCLKEDFFVTWDWERWERKDIKEVTMAEVEEKFGCKVKIIKGDNE